MIDACVEQNVPSLVYTSTTSVVIGSDDIKDGDETLPIPSQFMFLGYPETKYQGETLVLKANGRMLEKGENNVCVLSSQ